MLADQTGDASQVHLQQSAIACPRSAAASTAGSSSNPGSLQRVGAEPLPFEDFLPLVLRLEEARALPFGDYLKAHRRHQTEVVHVDLHQRAWPPHLHCHAALPDGRFQAGSRAPRPEIARSRRMEPPTPNLRLPARRKTDHSHPACGVTGSSTCPQQRSPTLQHCAVNRWPAAMSP